MNTTMLRTLVFCSATLIAAGIARTSHAAGKTIGNYSYDGSGNVSSIGPADDGLSNYYYYDSGGRLIRFARKASVSGAAVLEETYEYDGYGNLTGLTTAGTARPVPVSASTNRLTTAVYDAAGNVGSYDGVAYRFDPVGTLTEKTGSWGSAFYIYTADDERVGIAGPDGTWRYTLRDVDAKVLREWSAPTWNGPLTWVEDYVYRQGALAAAVRPASQGGTRHFHLDHLGTPRLITAADGTQYASHDYYPFGREITSPTQEMDEHQFDTPEPMKFTGHERDFAGTFQADPLDYMHARYYAPHLGRFLSVDPTWDSADLSEPQAWNRYAYVRNNPLKYTDPDGRIAVADDILIGAVVGGVILTEAYLQAPNASDPSRTNAEVMASSIENGVEWLVSLAEHTAGKRTSTKQKHETGQARKSRDKGKEKGDQRRRPPRKRPPGHKGPWPPKFVPVPVPDVQPQPAPAPQPPQPQPQPAPKGKEKEKEKEKDSAILGMFGWRF